MFSIAARPCDLEAARSLPDVVKDGGGWPGVERDLREPSAEAPGTRSLEGDQKAASLPRPQAAGSPLERDLVSISLFFPSWCLPNEMMLELKINRWVAG